MHLQRHQVHNPGVLVIGFLLKSGGKEFAAEVEQQTPKRMMLGHNYSAIPLSFEACVKCSGPTSTLAEPCFQRRSRSSLDILYWRRQKGNENASPSLNVDKRKWNTSPFVKMEWRMLPLSRNGEMRRKGFSTFHGGPGPLMAVSYGTMHAVALPITHVNTDLYHA